MRIPSRSIGLHVRYLDLNISLMSEGSSWSPDVADDMVARMGECLENTMRSMIEYGIMRSADGEVDNEEEDENEWGPQPEEELIDPRIVRLEDLDG